MIITLILNTNGGQLAQNIDLAKQPFPVGVVTSYELLANGMPIVRADLHNHGTSGYHTLCTDEGIAKVHTE